MKKILILAAIFLAYIEIGTAQYHPAPTYHPSARHAAPRQSAPRQSAPRQSTPRQTHASNPKPNNTQRNADRDKRNADKNAAKAHSNARKQENKARQARNKQLHSNNKAARAAFSNGRFSERFYGAHFGRAHFIGFCGPGRFWIGSPYDSAFWFGGAEFAFGPGAIWPGAWGRCDEFYIDYIDGVGYDLVDSAYAGVTLPLAVDINAQLTDEPDEQ